MRELVGKIAGFKIAGFDDIFERAQTCSAGGHSKNTWFIDFSFAIHLA